MKLFIICSFLITNLFAHVIQINEHFTSTDSSKSQITIEDKNASLKKEDIFHMGSNYKKSTSSYTKSVFWTKVDLINTTGKDIALVLRNPRAGMDKIDVYVYKDNRLINSYLLGDLREQKYRVLLSVHSAFYVTLPPHVPITIISKMQNLGPLSLNWEIFNTGVYSYDNSIELLLYGLFGGVVFALLIYSITMFFTIKDLSLVFYTLHSFSSIWFIYAISGVFYMLDIGLNLYFLTVSTWSTAYLLIAMQGFFVIYFFKLNKDKNIFYKLLLFLSFFNTAVSIVMMYQMYDHNWIEDSLYFNAGIYLEILLVFIFAVYAVYKKKSGSLCFLVGTSIYLVSIIYTAVLMMTDDGMSYISSYVMMSDDGMSYISSYALLFGLFFDSIFMFLALMRRVKIIKENNEARELIMMEEARFTSIGKNLGNVVHQWKVPMSQISSYMTYFEAVLAKENKDLLYKEVKENLPSIKDNIEYMNGVVSEVYQFYSQNSKVSIFDIKEQIELVTRILKDRLILSNIRVDIDCDITIKITNYKQSFANILMIFFDNSIYELETKKIKEPYIRIKIFVDDGFVNIFFSDNAGGIEAKEIHYIFDHLYSLKGSKGSGIGLYLAKMLVEEKMGGSISVSNSEDGAVFKVVFPTMIKSK